jgi:hypothetical protein
MHPTRTKKDLASWLPLTSWLEMRLNTPLTDRDVMRLGDGPEATESTADIVDLRTHLSRRDAEGT